MPHIQSSNTRGMSHRCIKPFEQTILPNYPLHHYLLYCPPSPLLSYVCELGAEYSSRVTKGQIFVNTINSWGTATLTIIIPAKNKSPGWIIKLTAL